MPLPNISDVCPDTQYLIIDQGGGKNLTALLLRIEVGG